MLTIQQKKFFKDNGYLVIKSFPGLKKKVKEIERELLLFAKIFDKKIKNLNEKKFYKILEKKNKNRKIFYDTLRYFFSLTQLTCSSILKKTSIQLGLNLPVVMRSYNLRMDMPNDKKHLFQWHQDITYLLGSKNSITFWLPLTKVDKFHGTIEIVEKSHKEGIFDFKYVGKEKIRKTKYMSPKDIILKKEPEKKTKLISARPGDLIVFSQFLLHRSTKNYSKKIRWVAQIRHSDISDIKHKQLRYSFGDKTNIFFTNYVKKFKRK